MAGLKMENVHLGGGRVLFRKRSEGKGVGVSKTSTKKTESPKGEPKDSPTYIDGRANPGG